MIEDVLFIPSLSHKSLALSISLYFLSLYPTVYVLSGYAKLTKYDESIPLDRNDPTSTSLIK